MTSVQRRAFNEAVTKFWSVAAPAYDLPWLQQFFYRPAQDEVIAVLRAHGARRIVDVACGTGVLAERIHRELQPDEVYGVDMSEGMLKEAKARCAAVQWLSAPAERLPFDDAALDAVVTTSAFHFFDQPAALREFRRVLRPGGIAAVTTIAPRHRLPLARVIEQRLAPAHTPTAEEMRRLFEQAGFTVDEQHRVRRPAWTRLTMSDLLTVGVNPG